MTLRRFSLPGPLLLVALFAGCDRAGPLESVIQAASTAGSGSTPTAPSGTTVVAVSASRIDVSWLDNSTNESGFEIHRSTTGASGPFAVLASTGADVTSHSDTGLASSTQYCYEVRAFRTTGRRSSYSAFSPTACATTPAPPPPPAPGSIRVTSTTTGIDPDPDGYSVSVSGATAGTTAAVPTNGTVTFPDLTAGEHVVFVAGVALNCALAGSHTRSVSVISGGTTEVAIDVACTATTQLAFVSVADGNAEIYVTNDNGTGATRLTTNAAWDVEPAWSPDRSRIAFTSDREGAAEIYVMQADGSSPVRLTTGGGSQASWSPDGTKIGFVRDVDIYVMNADGSNILRLTTSLIKAGFPTWSPDGSKIAFMRSGCGPYSCDLGDIYVMGADGSGPIQLTSAGADAHPAWSPDGTTLAFSRLTHCGFYFCFHDVFTMSADGSGLTQLTSAFWIAYTDPTWSPNGQWIAFEVSCDFYECSSRTVVAMRADGTESVELAPGFNPAWRQ